jgi:hypothetical protein
LEIGKASNGAGFPILKKSTISAPVARRLAAAKSTTAIRPI